MPPKKQQQDLNSTPYIAISVLPIIINSNSARNAFNKGVNIKKNIDLSKIIELLKEKGIDKFIKDDPKKVNKEGIQFICQNLTMVYQEAINQVKKPAGEIKKNPKDAKKDNKKQEQVVEQIEKPIQYNFEKDCSDFYFFLDHPSTPEELQIVLESGFKIDFLLVIKQSILASSQQPKYELLGQDRSIDNFKQMMDTLSKQTNTKKQDQNLIKQQNKKAKQILKKFLKFRKNSPKQSSLRNSIILQINYEKDLKNPQKDPINFLQTIFNKLCTLTKNKTQYLKWFEKVKTYPLIEPIKQIIKKQVQITDQKDQKKGAKKDSKAQIKTQIIEEIIQIKYQSLPQNNKSDLKNYKKIKKIFNKSQNNSISNILKLLLIDIDEQTKQKKILSQVQIKNISSTIKQDHINIPLNRISSSNLLLNLRKAQFPYIFPLCYQLPLNFNPIQTSISINQIKYANNNNINPQSLKFQYLIQQFERLVKNFESRFIWNFRDRKYRQKLTKQQLWGLINQQILKDSSLFKGKLQKDKINLLVLAQINPPGRIFYNTTKLKQKTKPNFQTWIKLISNKIQLDNQYLDYDYQQIGNLTIKNKTMIPSDNSVIQDQVYIIGDQSQNIIRIFLQNSIMGIKNIKDNQNCYWFKNNTLNMELRPYKRPMIKSTITYLETEDQSGVKKLKEQIVQEKHELPSTGIWIRKYQYTISFQPYPIIYYYNKTEKYRKISCTGVITREMNDGSIYIYSPQGDVCHWQHREWIQISNKVIKQNGTTRIPKFKVQMEGQQKITIRQDQTIFIQLPNGSSKIIFPDGTQIYKNTKPKTYLIKNPQNTIIRITFPQENYQENVIGYGSAFAYLGFTNILQRSCNGYLFEFFDNDFTTHLYLEKYQKDNIFHQQQIILIGLDNALLKVQNSGKITYAHKKQSQGRGKGTTRIYPQNSKLNQRWLQLFTTIENHGEGIYDIDLNQGSIRTVDALSNYFKVKVGESSQIKISVSFKINEQVQQQPKNFPNGFYIPQLNYFLPPPQNHLPARLFSIEPNGNYYQYLSHNQIYQFNGYKINKHKQNDQQIKYQLMFNQQKQNNIMIHTFTQNINYKIFQLPNSLQSLKTILNLTNKSYSNIYHRIVQEINWDNQFQKINKIYNEVTIKKKQRDQLQKIWINK